MTSLTNHMEELLVYADNEYYKLVCDPNMPVIMTKIQDTSSRLHNILPKFMHSHDNFNCIIDISNMMHVILLGDPVFPTPPILLDITKEKCDTTKIVSYSTRAYSDHIGNTIHYTFGVLFENTINFEIVLYEYFVFSIDYGKCFTEFSKLVIDKYIIFEPYQVTYTDHTYKCRLKNDSVISVVTNHYFAPKFYNIDGNIMTNTGYNTIDNRCVFHQCHNISTYKYFTSVYTNYSIYVDTDNNCHIVSQLETNKVCKPTNNSIISHNNNHRNITLIITNNHIIAILNDCTMLQFELPVKYVYHIANTKVRELMWSKNIHNKLPNNYKSIIRVFVMCNRLMKHLKIPHCVLPIIFSSIIN